MAGGKTMRALPEGRVLAEWGPMRLLISAFVGRVPQREAGFRAAEEAFGYLGRIASLMGLLKRRHAAVPTEVTDPLAVTMIECVLRGGAGDLTPMAAVAGTIADAVADFLFERGMTKVVVDNGGDVAVRLRGESLVKVGIRPETSKEEVSHVIALDSRRPSWGVATSGLGGRSLTRGVASAATIIAPSASLADAAATAVANASYVEDRHVIQCMAEEIDPDTDLKGLLVTAKIGSLDEGKREEALSRAMRHAEQLIRRKVILGGFVDVQGRVAMTDFFREISVQGRE